MQRAIRGTEARASDFDVQRPALRHGIQGVTDEMPHDLLHRGGIDLDHARVLVGLELHLDVGGQLAA